MVQITITITLFELLFYFFFSYVNTPSGDFSSKGNEKRHTKGTKRPLEIHRAET